MLMNKHSGVTLIEILVTLFVMSIGLLGLSGLQSAAVKNGMETAKRSQVIWVLSDIVERIRTNPDGVTHYRSVALNKLSCGNQIRACSLTVSCNARERANFDVWEAFCAYPQAASKDATGTIKDTLNLVSLNILYNRTANTYQAYITWQSKAFDNHQLATDEHLQHVRMDFSL